MPIDPEALTRSLRSLADREAPLHLVTSLQEVAEACVDIFGVSGSGIMVADDQNVTRYVAATNGPGSLLEMAESETGQGPCTEAFITNLVVPCTDVATDPRYPALAALVTPHGVHAVLGVPVRLGAITVGTLDVYRDHPHEWDEAEQAALTSYSTVIAATLAAALSAHQAQELAEQLQYALDYRVIIERGVGFLMARDGLDAVAAFDRLRRTARNTQTKIGEVAARLLETGDLPGTKGS